MSSVIVIAKLSYLPQSAFLFHPLCALSPKTFYLKLIIFLVLSFSFFCILTPLMK